MKKIKLELWDKEDFRNRKSRIITSKEIIEMPVPNDFIVCDFCNAEIKKFPVIVYEGYACCPKCAIHLILTIGEDEVAKEA